MDTQNKSKSEEKILKVAKGLKIATKVCYILSCIACLAFIVLAIVLPLTCKFSQLTKAEVAIMFTCLALYAFILIGVLWNAQMIFISIEKNKSPFGPEVTKYVKKTGIFVILLSIVPALVEQICVRIFADYSELYSQIQFGGIVAGVVLYMLGYFFDYGAELKQKNDETL